MDVEEAADRIRKYVEAHPRASDTCMAVAQWWLGPGSFGVSQETVLEALERLVTGGLLVVKRLRDGTVIYARSSPRGENEG